MNRTERLTAILLLLQERPRTSGELSRHFEVSRRTVLRDVQALCEMGMPLMAQDGANGGYSLLPGATLAPLALTSHEALLLLLSLEAIHKLSDMPYAPERATLAAKLRALLPSSQLRQVEELLQRISLDVPHRSQRAPYAATLLQRAHEKRWVRAVYRSERGRSTPLLLPLSLSSSNGFWYCRAYSHEAREERTYRVDRFEQIIEADPPEDAAAVPSPSYNDPSHPRIHVALTPSGILMTERDPHIGGLIRHTEDGGELDFHCPPSELDWYARFFGSMAGEAQVHAPEVLRAKIRRIGSELTEAYGER